MSACLIYQTKSECYIGADTAISSEKRLYGEYEKLFNHNGELIFSAGLTKFCDIVKEFIESDLETDIDNLRKFCLRNYGTEDWYYTEDNKKLICEVVVVKRIRGIVHTYILSSTSNFKIEEIVAIKDEVQINAIGINNEELLTSFRKHYDSQVNKIVMNKVFESAFNDVVNEFVGGHLDFYALLEGSYIGKPISTNKVIQYRFKLKDKYEVSEFDLLMNYIKAHCFLGTELDSDGIRRAKMKLFDSDGKTTLIDDRGLTLKDQVNFVDNLSSNAPMIIPYRVDEGVREIRKAILTLYLKPFRVYSKGLKAGGTISTKGYSSFDGGGGTSESGGGYYNTISSGMESYVNMYSNFSTHTSNTSQADHYHHIDKEQFQHYHNSVLNLSPHFHQLKSHSHITNITLDTTHNHEQIYGCIDLEGEEHFPSNCSVYINDVLVRSGINSNVEIDITNKIKLNQMNTIRITSATNGRIVANVFMSNFSSW